MKHKNLLGFLVVFAIAMLPMSVKAQCAVTCGITVQCTDSYGDGWNGNAINVFQGGTLLNSVTLASGSYDEIEVNVCDDETLVFIWATGNYAYEASFTILNGDESVIVTGSGGSYSTGDTIAVATASCPSCLKPTDLTASNITSDGMTIEWIDTTNGGASYTLAYWTANGDTTVVSDLTTTGYNLSNLDANTAYNISVVANCSSTESSTALTGSFRTLCAGTTCDITLVLSSTSEWSDPWTAGAAIEFWQGGGKLAEYTQSGAYPVCSSDTLTVKYHGAQYSYYDAYAHILVQDGGNMTVYDGGNGDVLAVVASPCPTCIPPTDLTVVPDVDALTFSWTPRSTAMSYLVYLDGVMQSVIVYDTFYTFSNLDANTGYTLGVQAVCSLDDTSSIVSLATRTACSGNTCDLTLVSSSSYSFDSYTPLLTVYQKGDVLATVRNEQSIIEVCGTDTVVVIYTAPMYTYYTPTATVTDGGGTVLFSGATDSYYTGDTLALMASPCPSCIPPTALLGSSDETEIEFSWTPRSDAIGYVLYLDDSVVSEFVTDTFYTFTNLTSNTAYTLGVRAICTYDDTSNMATLDKRTACSDIVLPTTITWEDIPSNGAWPSYWDRLLNYNTDPSVNYEANHTTGGSYSMYLQAYYGNYNMFAMQNPLPMEDNAVSVTFWLKLQNNGASWVKAGVMSDLNDTASFIPMLTITNQNATWTEYEFNTSSLSSDTAYYLAFQGYSTATYGAFGFIDDIELNIYSGCARPEAAYVDSTSTDEAYLRWNATPSGSYQVAYATVNNVDSAQILSESDTTTVIYGLTPMTQYWFWVRSVCGGEYSAWREGGSFATACANATCELTVETHDSYGDGWNGNAINAYQSGILIGSATLASGSNGSEDITVCSGTPVELRFHQGSYSSEISFTIFDGAGTEVYTATQGSMSSVSDGSLLASVANPCPSCITPNGVMAAAADSSELTFIWTVDPNVVKYLVSFNGGAFVENNTGIHTEYGLLPNTVYTFSVKAVCVVGVDTSSVRTVTGKTSCGQMTIPYVEGFEDSTPDEVPSCWTVVIPGANSTPNVGDDPHTGEQCLSIATSAGESAMIASGAIPLPGDSIKVSFWANNSGYYTGTLEAGVMTNPFFDSTFTSMVTVGSNGDYTLYEFNTSTLSADSTYYLAFRYSGSSSYYPVYIDDINITLDEGCMYPSNVTATPDTASPMAVITWTNTGSVNDFVVEYRVGGSNVWSAPAPVMGLTYTINSLTASTTYEVRVGLVCGADTLWTYSSFMTACLPAAVPYFENFYSVDGSLPPCWYVSNPSVIRYDNWPYSNGNGALQGGYSSAGEYAVLPQFDAPIGKLEISFDAKVGNVSEGDGMVMGVYNDATNTVEWLDTLTNPGQSRENYVRFTYNYTNYFGTGNRIAITHSHNNPSDWGFYVDSIIVIALPDCFPPEDVTAHNTLYPNTADDVYFTWTPNGPATQWEIYIDTNTSTVDIDSVSDSLLITVDTAFYQPAINTLAEGAHYRFFIRSSCGPLKSNWVEMQNGFVTDGYWMNQTVPLILDTITGCDFIIYDNGGPVAGYLHNSSSGVIIQAGEVGRELQLQGAFLNFGDDAATFTVYDSIGTSGQVLYQRNTSNAHDQFEYIDSVLATSTTGALTITFTSGYSAALGYELYIHCVGTASCPKPTNLAVEMVGDGEATATWDGSASSYRVYHRAEGDSVWNMLATTTNSVTFTGIPADVMYEFFVVALCSATDTSSASIIRHFNTHYEAPYCDTVSNVTVGDIEQTTAVISWTSDGTLWEVELNGAVYSSSTTTATLTDLTANSDYSIRVRNVCDAATGFYSDWSAVVTFHTPDYPPIDTTGIDDVEAMAGVVLYPNPASTSVTVSLDGHQSAVTVAIVDLNGRRCGEWKVEDNQLVIDLTGFARGAYFVRVTDEQATVVRKLVVK